MNSKWGSRKFLLVLGAALTSLGAALSGNIEWDTAMKAIIASVVGYLGVEGVADAAGRWKNGGSKPPGNGTPPVETAEATLARSGARGAISATASVDMRVLPDDLVLVGDTLRKADDLSVAAVVVEVRPDGALVVRMADAVWPPRPRTYFVWWNKPRR